MTVTFSGVPSHALQLKLKMLNAVLNPGSIAVPGLALFRFRSPLLTKSRLISLPPPT